MKIFGRITKSFTPHKNEKIDSSISTLTEPTKKAVLSPLIPTKGTFSSVSSLLSLFPASLQPTLTILCLTIPQDVISSDMTQHLQTIATALRSEIQSIFQRIG